LEKNLVDVLNQKSIRYTKISKYKLIIDDYEFYFINKKESLDENNDSFVIYTKINGWNILLMGDVESTVENYLLNEYNLEKVDILKVGHHGSKTSSTDKFIKNITPKISLISAGINNKFNHPHEEVKNMVVIYIKQINWVLLKFI